MITKKVEKALNQQVALEASSSQYYLAMASWTETLGLEGVASFLYKQSDEERMHMLKLVKYINERGGKALIPALDSQPQEFESVQFVFEKMLSHEELVSSEINNLVEICLNEKDHTTQHFLQWYVSEQIEEEAVARRILDKLKFIGNDKAGMYFFDRDLGNMAGGEVPIQQ